MLGGKDELFFVPIVVINSIWIVEIQCNVITKKIDDLSEPEWGAMQEKISTDGNGDLLMIEELDDMSYSHNDYVLNHVFVKDNEKGLLQKLTNG